MASTFNDFIHSAINRAKAGAQGTYDWMAQKAGGLRGAAKPVDLSYEPPSGMKNTAENARASMEQGFRDSRVQAARPGVLQPPRFDENQMPSKNARGQRPAWGSGASPEAQALQQKPSQPASRLAGLRGAGATVAKGLGVIPPALAAGSAASSFGTDTDEFRKDFGLGPTTAVGRGLRAVGVPENAAQLGDDLAVRGAGTLYRAANAATGGIVDSMLKPGEAQAAPAPKPAAYEPPPNVPGAPAAPAPKNPDLVDTIRGSQVTPESMIQNRGDPMPAYGQGAIQVTDARGVKQPARKVGYTAPTEADRIPSSRTANDMGLPGRAAKAPEGVFGEMAQMKGLRTQIGADQLRDRASEVGLRLGATVRGQDMTAQTAANRDATERRGQDLTAGTAAARLRYDAGEKNREVIDKHVTDYVNAKIPVVSEGTLMDRNAIANRDAQVKQRASQVKTRVRYTAAAMGGGEEHVTPQLAQRALLGEDMREKVEKYRGSTASWARDFFGNKRFDSRDLRDYMPAMDRQGNVKAAERTSMPFESYVITLGNGSKLSVGAAADGSFNWLGPNEPVDNQMMALIAPAIEAAKKAAQKGQ